VDGNNKKKAKCCAGYVWDSPINPASHQENSIISFYWERLSGDYEWKGFYGNVDKRQWRFGYDPKIERLFVADRSYRTSFRDDLAQLKSGDLVLVKNLSSIADNVTDMVDTTSEVIHRGVLIVFTENSFIFDRRSLQLMKMIEFHWVTIRNRFPARYVPPVPWGARVSAGQHHVSNKELYYMMKCYLIMGSLGIPFKKRLEFARSIGLCNPRTGRPVTYPSLKDGAERYEWLLKFKNNYHGRPLEKSSERRTPDGMAFLFRIMKSGLLDFNSSKSQDIMRKLKESAAKGFYK